MAVATEFEAANANYAASFTKGDLQLPPQRYVILYQYRHIHLTHIPYQRIDLMPY